MSRITKLIGYQIIHRVNNCDKALLDVNRILKFQDPLTEVGLSVVDAVTRLPRLATVADVKEMVNCNMRLIESDGGSVVQFATRYSDKNEISSGLHDFSVQKAHIDSDLNTCTTTRTALNASLVTETEKDRIRNLAASFEDWIPLVAKIVRGNEIDFSDGAINTFQDLLNAMAFECRGIHSYTGQPHNMDFNALSDLMANRIRVSNRAWRKTPQTPETLEFKAVLDNVNDGVKSVMDLNGFISIGNYIDSKVPQLPLVRRWWRF